MSEIRIIIGSWGSYNECNERTLGSKWLDLEDFDTYEEIEEEQTKQNLEEPPIFSLVRIAYSFSFSIPRFFHSSVSSFRISMV